MIVAVASRKASPGVSTLAALLCWLWPDDQLGRLLLEADPSGGSLAPRWNDVLGTTWDPGLLELASTQGQLDSQRLGDVSQSVSLGVRLVGAPPGPQPVSAALESLGDSGAAQLASLENVVVVADCGRLSATSPSLPLARRAALTLLVCRPVLDEIYSLAPAVAELSEAGCNLGLVCVGSAPYKPVQVAEQIGIPLVGSVADDVAAAKAVNRSAFTKRGLRRGGLARSAAELATVVESQAVAVNHRYSPQSQASGDGSFEVGGSLEFGAAQGG